MTTPSIPAPSTPAPGLSTGGRDWWDDSADAYDQHTRRYDTHKRIAGMLTLLAPHPPAAVLDFGCGPGNSTRLLRRAMPDATISGLDSSPAMIKLARRNTSDPTIAYHCGDPTTGHPPAPLGRGCYDLVVAANSLFHVADKPALLRGLLPLLAPDATIVFSLYDTVFQPNHVLRWPLHRQHDDLLMTMLIERLRSHGHTISARDEDREILTETTLTDLFTTAGFTLRCQALLRLHRTAAERLSFFSIPATAAEVFPGIPTSQVQTAAASLLPVTRELPDQERSVFAFTATRSDQ
ncbi:class I SAM-dependent methyltransferase [Paractinoplanes rishiriensis]|uniref:Methyltransferase n=1 Tax=Paractinoplanes rishiriensis TaxID=1050105 RepID=A0A919K5Z7_9ACTN|nr:class I SAM-dependent methyltransferase [Actinoplanes rishiriensis]GIF01552.1 hypothetical protein Ari01nite_90160 [Actinoplanes rishiriensis]